MPSLNVPELIRLLEQLEINLGILWDDIKNYEHLEQIDRMITKLVLIIQSLKNLP